MAGGLTSLTLPSYGSKPNQQTRISICLLLLEMWPPESKQPMACIWVSENWLWGLLIFGFAFGCRPKIGQRVVYNWGLRAKRGCFIGGGVLHELNAPLWLTTKPDLVRDWSFLRPAKTRKMGSNIGMTGRASKERWFHVLWRRNSAVEQNQRSRTFVLFALCCLLFFFPGFDARTAVFVRVFHHPLQTPDPCLLLLCCRFFWMFPIPVSAICTNALPPPHTDSIFFI